MPACARCQTPYGVGQRFCGNCGTQLDASVDVVKLIDDRLAARLKDQKLVEVETAQAIVARIGEWTKLFGFFIAFPLGILVIILTVLGFRQYSDLVQTVETSKADLSKQLNDIKSEFAAAAESGKTARQEGDQLNRDIGEIRKVLDLSQAARIRSELEQLSARVSGIENRFKISGPGVPGTLERSLTVALAGFADYMEAIGFNAKQARATVTFETRPAQGTSLNSYYDPAGARVVVDARFKNLETDASMVLWPYAQHLMVLENKIATGPPDGAGAALGNGIPDYFVASYLNEPRVGRGYPGAATGYLRNADNQRKFDPATVTAPHDLGEIWAGVFWTVRKTAGQRFADRLVFNFWKSLRQSDFTDVTGAAAARRLIETAKGTQDGAYAAVVRDALQARNLRF